MESVAAIDTLEKLFLSANVHFSPGLGHKHSFVSGSSGKHCKKKHLPLFEGVKKLNVPGGAVGHRRSEKQ